MLAGFVILRLRNILGRKTGHQSKSTNRFFPKGLEVIKDVENNEAIKTGNVEENAKKQKHELVNKKKEDLSQPKNISPQEKEEIDLKKDSDKKEDIKQKKVDEENKSETKIDDKEIEKNNKVAQNVVKKKSESKKKISENKEEENLINDSTKATKETEK